MKSDIVIVGSLNMDMVVKIPRMPLPGETLSGGDLQTIPGGKGANQATAAARLGHRVGMVGCVGNDSLGSRLVGELNTAHVDTSHVRICSDAATGTAVILVDGKGENSIVLSPGANGRVSAEDVSAAEEMISQAKIILLQLEIPLNTVSLVVDTAQKHQIPLILNPAPAKMLPQTLLRKVTYLIPNETEATLLTGIEVIDIETAEKAAKNLISKEVRTVIITMGSRGALLVDGDRTELVPAEKVPVVDTTAAGDAFIGGFAAALVKNFPLVEAVRFAVCAGSLTVQKFGAQTSLPTASEVESVYAERR
jgi:ribokinase